MSSYGDAEVLGNDAMSEQPEASANLTHRWHVDDTDTQQQNAFHHRMALSGIVA